MKTYWDPEQGEIKFQIADGCAIDQVLAQWHANICGLGEIFDKKQRIKALESIYKYNFRRPIRSLFNPFRVFALNNESGVVIYEWTKKRFKPFFALPHAQEAMTGFEYAAASHMIQEGLIDQGLEIMKAVRSRYDGEKRNPWNESECGSNYARSMASYSLLLALSGFEFDLVKKEMGFNPPRTIKGNFRCFWCLGTGWGIFETSPERISIAIKYGKISIKHLNLPFIRKKRIRMISIGDKPVHFKIHNSRIELNKTWTILKGQKILIQILDP